MSRLLLTLVAIASFGLMGCNRTIDASQFNAQQWEKQLKSTSLSEEEFTHLYALKAATEIRGATVRIVGERELKVKLENGTELTAYLDNAWAEAAKNPTNRTEIVSRYLAALKAAQPAAAKKDVPLDTNNIVVVVRDQRFVAQLDRLSSKPMERVISETLVADFRVLYVLDQEGHIQYLTERDLNELKIDRSALRTLAMSNLKRLLPEVNRRGKAPLFMIVADGNYETSLLLADNLWEEQQKVIEGELVAAAPARDTLVFTGTKSEGGIAKLRQIVVQVENGGAHLITGTLIVRRNGQWETFNE